MPVGKEGDGELGRSNAQKTKPAGTLITARRPCCCEPGR